MKSLITTIVMVLVVLISFETVAQARHQSGILPQQYWKDAERYARNYGGYNYSSGVLPQQYWKDAERYARNYGGYNYSPVVLPRHIRRNNWSLQIFATRDFVSIGGGITIRR